jgi:MoaA/NifB/PqqE/SkfB family radical SAM enzyme
MMLQEDVPMDFFEQLKTRTDLPQVNYPHVPRAKGLGDKLLASYLKRFGKGLGPMKPIAMVNQDMPVYDLTQPPMNSAPGARVLRTGLNYMLLRKEARPINMVLMLNAACNMRCAHCSARDYLDSNRKPLETSEVKNLVDQFVELGGSSLIYSGGEPTIHKDLLELIDYVPKEKSVISIFTNGSRLADLAPELRSAGLFGTLVSIDSADADEHDRLRGAKGAFAGAVRGVEALHEQGMLVGISSYMTRQNLADGDWDRIMALANQLKAYQVFMFDAVPTGAIMHETHTRLSPADRNRLKELTMAQNATPSGPAVMGQSWVNSADGFGCFAGFYQLYVNSFGDVCPCDFTPISFGNIREEPLVDIWAKLRQSSDWGQRFPECRMQDDTFRSRSVDLIPSDLPWPVSYETLLELRRDAGIIDE